MKKEAQTALVTGSSGGIGYEFAKQLAEKGVNLIITGRNEERLQRVKEEMESQHGISVYVIIADLSKTGEAERLYNQCSDFKIDYLINNAGAGLFGEVTEISHKAVEDIMYLNMQSLTTLCALYAKEFKKKGRGNILNIGSLAGNQPTPFFASYAASKAYVLNYSLALREELKPFGINVSCLQPGYVSTAFDDNSLIKSESYKKFSLKNSLTPERVAKTGLKLMFSKKACRIPGVQNKVTAFLTAPLGKKLQAKILCFAIKRLAGVQK